VDWLEQAALELARRPSGHDPLKPVSWWNLRRALIAGRAPLRIFEQGNRQWQNEFTVQPGAAMTVKEIIEAGAGSPRIGLCFCPIIWKLPHRRRVLDRAGQQMLINRLRIDVAK
jgi:hypothetical protein